MSEFKKQLEMAQAFQLELSGVEWISVSVGFGAVAVLPGIGEYVTVDVHSYKDGKHYQHLNLSCDEVTEQALEDIKDNLRGLGHEV